ncbi:thiamine biosynthesis protein ApbE [Candidatus Termititenax aidoneus]|uniref:FAD:protein FMN transferase n=1 Tax=Termititenax aidoneus TaxID=2218524 RepID=A0A388T9U3_TERA1|nr:thiamine biosynthesis protein ApbE [Candidatus Termititenax aidoneus]
MKYIILSPMSKKQRGALLLAALCLVWWLLDSFVFWKEVAEQRYVLHTLAEIRVLCHSRQQGRQAINTAFAKMKELEEKFNYFDPGSELSRINQNAFRQEMPLSGDMNAILTLALAGSEISGGTFDITITPISRLYGFGTEQKQKPDQRNIQNQMQGVGWQKVRLDSQKQTVRLLHSRTQLDLGGIAKGYAVDQAVETLQRHGIRHALVNAGGNIFALGQKRGKPWRIAIRDPRAVEKTLQVFELSDEACATSGDYEQYFVADGQRYSHIFNPQTGRPANLENELASVTVIADSAARADLLSTACFVLGVEKSSIFPEKKFFYKANAD